MPMRILLAEDDVVLADGLARALRQSGCQVDWADSGTQADRQLIAESYDLAILDLKLPGLEGSEVLRRLRGRKQWLPTLILTACDALAERVRLLDLGADDFLVKPVALRELEARIRALVRRGKEQPEAFLHFGRLTLDSDGKRALIDGAALELTAREWAALDFLARHARHVVSKEDIINALYDGDRSITPNAVEKAVSRLRAKIETSGVVIRTIRGLGYYLEPPDSSRENTA